ncbi:MAG: hypothetical protein IAF00_02605, partial [Phycisphaerales bacterium]|nr:hypothetical protein [Phycisphaerales bacterium]
MPVPLCLFRFISPDVVEWLPPDGTIQRGPLAGLADQIGGVRLILAAPSEAVTLHRVLLPSRKRSTWA